MVKNFNFSNIKKIFALRSKIIAVYVKLFIVYFQESSFQGIIT